MAVLDAIVRGSSIAIMAVMGSSCFARGQGRSWCGRCAVCSRLSPDTWCVRRRTSTFRRQSSRCCSRIPARRPILVVHTSVLGDDERPDSRHVVVLAATVVVGLARPDRVADAAYYAGSVALVTGALVHVLRGLAADLVEPRRRVRAAFSMVVGIEILIIIAIELWLAGTTPSRELELLKSVGALALTMLFAGWLLAPRADLTAALPTIVDPTSSLAVAAPSEAPDADARFRQRLIAAMEHEHLYRREGLTIRALADTLGVPEYRLRRIINEQLGHRNFNAFINELRTAEACRILADPAHERLPILNLALDLGYGSVGPFNRAFRARTGLTPTEFRQAQLPGASGMPPAASSAES